jgi:hypothetical protein
MEEAGCSKARDFEPLGDVNSLRLFHPPFFSIQFAP